MYKIGIHRVLGILLTYLWSESKLQAIAAIQVRPYYSQLWGGQVSGLVSNAPSLNPSNKFDAMI